MLPLRKGGKAVTPKAEFIPAAEVKIGQVIAVGTVTGIRRSKSGKTVYFTTRDASGERERAGRGTGTRVMVFAAAPAGPAACDYQPAEGDPAIRVCVTHDRDLGLYGDEDCAGAAPLLNREAGQAAFEAVCAAVAVNRPGMSPLEAGQAARALAADRRVAHTALCVVCESEPQDQLNDLVRRVLAERPPS